MGGNGCRGFLLTVSILQQGLLIGNNYPTDR